jgi:hypothetical protein
MCWSICSSGRWTGRRDIFLDIHAFDDPPHAGQQKPVTRHSNQSLFDPDE